MQELPTKNHSVCAWQVIAFGPITGVVASGILYGIPTSYGLLIGNRLKKAAVWVRFSFRLNYRSSCVRRMASKARIG